MAVVNLPPSQIPVYATTGALPTGLSSGAQAVVEADNSLYLYNGTAWIQQNGGGGGSVTGSGTVNAIAIWDGATDLTDIGVLTNGQLIIGHTGNAPATTTLTATSNQTTVTNGAGSITVGTVQNIGTTSTPTFASETLTANTNQLTLGTTNTTTLTMAALSGSRVVTLPNADSNTVRPISATTSNWVTNVDSTGVQHISQPAFSDISGTITPSQLPALNQQNIFYVTKSGNDTTGDGSFVNPYLTISKALTIIGSSTSQADFNDATKQFYSIVVGPGVYTEDLTVGTRPFIIFDLSSALVVGDVTQNFDQGNIGSGALLQTKLIIKGSDLRSAFAGSSLSLSGIQGNVVIQSTNSGSSLTAEVHIIQSGVTGTITQQLGSGGGVFTLQLFIESGIVGGNIINTSGSGSITLYAANCDTSSTHALQGTSGAVNLNILRNVRFDGTVVTSGGGGRWFNTTFSSNAHNFTGSSSTIVADANSYSSFFNNVPTKGTVTFTLVDEAEGVKYAPTTSGNWNSVPTTVLTGLDTLATSGVVKAQSANIVLAGPSSGGSAVPAFRSLVAADIPLISLTTGVSGVLPVANGGTNSSTALNNNRIIVSSGNAIVEASAITANRALASNASGVPIAATTTDVELGYVNGVTSAIQTQLNAKAADNIVIKKDGSVTYTANQPMGAFKLTGLGAGSGAGDSVRYEQAILASGVNAWAANQSLGGFLITNSGAPVNPNDLANKLYVDNLAQGLSWKQTTRSATTTTLPTYIYNNGASGVGATLTGNSNGALSTQDGVTLSAADRLLVKDETGGNQPYNGIYTLTQVGDVTHPYILTRATDADIAAELQWATVEVGPDASTQAGYIYRESADIVTMGTDNVTFANVSQGLAYVFTSGVQQSGNTVSAHVDNSTLDVNGSNQIEVKSGGIANTQIASGAAIAVNKLAAVTANRAVASDASGFLTVSATTDTELGYVNGVTSSIQTQLNGKQSTGNYITALTSDVTASGPGSVAATVAFVGGSSAANVHSAELLANAATSSNTINTIVKRDGSGDFSAGVISATTENLSANTNQLVLGTTNTTTVTMSSLTASRTFTLPDANSNSVIPSTAGANQFATAISSGGVVTYTQPSFSNISGVNTIAGGGTNSGTSLNNNRFIVSSGGAIVEASAVTANRAVVSDASGLPTAATTTSTEIGYVNGVTSAIQTQLNSKQTAFTGVNVSSNVTLTNNAIHFVDTSTARSLTFPVPTAEVLIVIKDSTFTANTNNITLLQHASEQIEGVAGSYKMDSNGENATFTSDGTNWFRI